MAAPVASYKLAQDNLRWRVVRLQGELRRPGHWIGAGTIHKILHSCRVRLTPRSW